MNIRIATPQDEPAWNHYVLTHPDGLAYHLFAWKNAVQEAYGFDSCYLIAEQNQKITGLLPLIDFKIPILGRSFVSLPYCDVGGCLADTQEVKKTLADYAITLGREKKVKKIELRQTTLAENIDSHKVRMILKLPDSSETLLAGFKSKLRSQVKKPIRDGLTTQLGGTELVPEFYQVFRENMRDLGSPVHHLKWIESIVRFYADNVKVGIAYTPEGIPAAGGIILMTNTTVSIPWASALLKFKHYNPNMLLYWSLLSFAADNGYRYFDFGRSTPGEGTYKFKQQWGAEPLPLEWIDLLHPASVSASQHGGMREKVEKIWQKLPVGMATMVGPRIRKYISL